MLKYLYSAVVFSEIPSEISLGVSLSGCTIHCEGCHSPELWQNKGTLLTVEEIDRLLHANKGVTCLLLMGGEHDIDSLTELFQHVYKQIKTAWYCGLDEIPKDKLGILQYLDYVKIGPYKKELGGLTSPTTNQRLYYLKHEGDKVQFNNITNQLINN